MSENEMHAWSCPCYIMVEREKSKANICEIYGNMASSSPPQTLGLTDNIKRDLQPCSGCLLKRKHTAIPSLQTFTSQPPQNRLKLLPQGRDKETSPTLLSHHASALRSLNHTTTQRYGNTQRKRRKEHQHVCLA